MQWLSGSLGALAPDCPAPPTPGLTAAAPCPSIRLHPRRRGGGSPLARNRGGGSPSAVGTKSAQRLGPRPRIVKLGPAQRRCVAVGEGCLSGCSVVAGAIPHIFWPVSSGAAPKTLGARWAGRQLCVHSHGCCRLAALLVSHPSFSRPSGYHLLACQPRGYWGTMRRTRSPGPSSPHPQALCYQTAIKK